MDSEHRRNPRPFNLMTTRGRPAFSRCGLLPAPRKPLQLRFGEQNLHTISAPPPGADRLFRGAVCSPLSANPCGSVPGSKIFTQFPRRPPRPAGFFEARFAPRSLRTLEAPFRGAQSSHNSRAAARGRPAFSRRGLLPVPRKPLQLYSGEQNLHTIPAPPPGEQNLHTISAPPPGAGRLFRGAVCSPLPANPCNSVPGNKFFTLFPRLPSKNPRSTFCFGDFSFTFIFLYLSISSRWDSGFRK